MSAEQSKNQFVEDGAQRLYEALRAQLTAELADEYRDRLAAASWLGRLRLRWQLRCELTRRLRRAAQECIPPDGLYFAR
jgi:hypothetical protein